MKKPKMLEIGKLYKAPWRFHGHGGTPGTETYYFNRIDIEDGSYVIVLDIKTQAEVWPTLDHYTTVVDYYWFKVLTGDAETAWIQVSLAGMGYWKKMNPKKST